MGRWRGGQPPGDEHDPGERGAPRESLAAHLHGQALALRLAPEDAAVLRFLIESLNEDGYLEDSLAQLAATLVDDGDELDALDTLVHRFNFALKLLQSMEPAGVGARDLPECLSLQLRARLADATLAPAAQASARAALALLASPRRWTRWPGATCAAWRRPAARTKPRCAPPWP
jgi:RNA polymerase sigma-54 factor